MKENHLRGMSSILIPLASSQQNLYDIYPLLCVQCSARLLTMDREIVRNV